MQVGSDTLLEVKGLCKSYQGHAVVHDMSFSLQRGDVLGFLGPNGAGKSTTMRMLSGLTAPDAGTVAIAGFDMRAAPKQAKRHLGYLPETPPIYADHRVEEQLQFAGRLQGLRRHALSQAVDCAIDDLELQDVRRQLVKQLSKGFQQRLGIAQAIIHRPDIIILDEPTAGLDPNQLHRVQALIRKLATRHAVILSTHILSDVARSCNRILMIHGGRCVYEGDIETDATHHHRLVKFAGGITAAQIGALDGIQRVDETSDEQLLIQFTSESAMTEFLPFCIKQNWTVTEFSTPRHHLEALFHHFTQNQWSHDA